MITPELIQGMYAFNSDTVTTNELNKLGFNSHDIKKLLDEGYLFRQKRGIYNRALNKEQEYLKEQMSIGNDLISSIIMKRMLEGEDSVDNAFYIAILYIENKDYDNAFKILDNIFKREHDEKTHKIILFSMYMLGQIIELPSEYKELIEDLEGSTIYSDGSEDSFYPIINSMIDNILSSDYNGAYNDGKRYNELVYGDHTYGVIWSLVCELKRIDTENNEIIKNAIDKRDFKYIVDFYKKVRKKRPLTIDEETILHLAKTIDMIVFLDDIAYSAKKYKGSSIYMASLDFDFYEAYKLLCNKSSLTWKEFIIRSLLKEIIDLEMQIMVRKSSPVIPTKAMDIIKERDYETALRFLEIYFEDEKKIKLGESVLYWILIQDDIDDISTRMLFRDIKGGNFGRNIDRFLAYLHESYNNGNFIEANLIIDIIRSYDENLIERFGLSEIDEKIQAFMERISDKNIKNVVINSLNNSKKTGRKIGYIVGEKFAHKKNIWFHLERVSNEGGAFIYTSKDEKELIELEREINKRYYNILVRRISFFRDPAIIIKHHLNYVCDMKDVYTNAKEAFKNGDIVTSKKLFLNLLAQFERPYSIIYKRLAEISEMEKDYAAAVEYYKLYTNACYEENNPDYKYMNGKIQEDRYLAYIYKWEVKQKRREEEQRYKEYNTFADILFEDYNSLDDLVKRMRLSSEEVKIVQILVAKRCIDHDMMEDARKIIEPIKTLDDNSDEVTELLNSLPIENLSEVREKLDGSSFVIKPKKQ